MPASAAGSLRKPLTAQHRAHLEARAIAPHVGESRGYFSAERRRDLEELGFQGRQAQLVPSLAIPIFDVRGEIAFHQLRPDTPREKNAKKLKYETKAGARMVIDVPPGAREKLADPTTPLFITEGPMKADAAVSQGLCCIALLGVWNWRGRNEFGGTLALPCWESIPLNDRAVYVAFDSDVMEKQQVAHALRRLGVFLEGRGAQVHYVYLPPATDGSKQGLDDYFAAGGTLAELLRCATTELRGLPGRRDASDYARPYAIVNGQTVLEKHTKDGVVDVPLCNFAARIVREEVHDDGVEEATHYRIEGHLASGERMPVVEVSADRFGGMQWTAAWGNRAVIFAGSSIRDHLRAAVQLLSGEVLQRVAFTHTGWRRIGEQWIYLHAGGALGPDGTVEGIAVSLPEPLRRLCLPDPPNRELRRDAVRASLAMLDVAEDRVTVALLSAVYRSVIDSSDFSVHLAGFTGVFKSELAALVQQHLGAELDARHLPASWSSTGNQLEILAFHAKDTILAVDDYAPSGSSSDIARMQREAERLLRAQGNRLGRGRLRADASLRPVKPPRGMILSTGEDVPGSQSVRARLVVIDVQRGDVKVDRLSVAQEDAATGQYAAAMAAFISWLAPRRDEAREQLRESVREWRGRIVSHRRYADSIGQLAAAFELLLEFALESGAVSRDAATTLRRRAEAALLEVAGAQAVYQRAADPVTRFVELVVAAFVSGAAHLADGDDESEPPRDAEQWGWRVRRTETVRMGDPNVQETCQPQGRRIGWIREGNVYLEPAAAFAEAQRLAQFQGAPLAIRPETLWSRMVERGLIASHQSGRFTAQPRIGGRQHRAIHLRADIFIAGGGVSGVHGVDTCEGAPEALSDTIGDTAERNGLGVTDVAETHANAVPSLSDNSDTADTVRGVGDAVSNPDAMEIF